MQFQHCPARAREVVSIPMDLSRKESLSTELEEVRMIWKSKKEEIDEQKLLPTGNRRRDRRLAKSLQIFARSLKIGMVGGEE